MRRPIGSTFGQYFLAVSALMMTTSGDEVVSRAVKSRPFNSGMPIALK